MKLTFMMQLDTARGRGKNTFSLHQITPIKLASKHLES